MFNIENYHPPKFSRFEGSWNDKAANLMGKLVTEEGNYYGSGEELYEELGYKIADLWAENDEDPDPKYDWHDVMLDLCIRFWENDKAANPELGSGTRRVDGDVLIIDRYQKAGTEAIVMSFDEALTKEFDFDAHFVPAVGPTCRPNKSMADSMFFSYLVFDLDTPEHAPLSDCMDWLEDVVRKLESHEDLKNYRAFYTTRGGCRIVYEPERYLTGREMQEMRQVYNSMFRGADIEVDEACKDVSRLFRLPRVVRDGEVEEPMICDTTVGTVPVIFPPKEIKNYRWEEDIETGKRFKVPVVPDVVLDQIFEATGGWPKVVSGQLFHLHDGEVSYLDDANSFLMWLQKQVDFMHIFEGSGFLTKTELFTYIKMWNPHQYETVHKYPYEPACREAFLLNEINCTDSGATPTLDKLLEFFHPDSEVDKIIMKSAFCTPMFNTKNRPVFTIDSSSGRGAGKTSLVEVVGDVYGGVIKVDVADVKRKLTDEAKRCFFYEGGRSKRVVLVDNVTGFFGNDSFASVVTSDSLSARRPYAKSMESRKNDVVWFLTSNDANYDKDYISRSVFLKLKNHPPVQGWEGKVKAFVEKNREIIQSEIIGLIRSDSKVTLPTFTRFVDWEHAVLQKVCGCDEKYSKVMKSISSNKEEYDSDLEVCGTITGILLDKLVDPKGNYFIQRRDLFNAYKEEGGEMGYQTFRSVVSEAVKTGSLGELRKVETNNGRHKKGGKYCWFWGSEPSDATLTNYKMGRFQPV